MRRCIALAAFALAACGAPATVKQPAAASARAAPDATPKAPLEWAEFNDKTFARAKAERKFVVMDGSAEWCHWCHVMEAVTYHDPAVSQILRERFIAAKVDVDSRPDIEERYAAYGWPATVIFSPDAAELGKYRGYIAPDEFAELLRAVVSAGAGPEVAAAKLVPLADAPLTAEQMASIARSTQLGLDAYWDDAQAGWGHQQKLGIPTTNAWTLQRARTDAVSRQRALAVLGQQRKIMDPIWGGIYQYSTDGDWEHPHFEKLMTYNAGALDNYAEAFELTGDAAWLDTAKQLRGFISRFMMSPEGGFYATIDADLNAHEVGKTFLTGHEYYAKGEADRLALGSPRIDTHEYGRENGLVIAALCSYFRATRDVTARDQASRCAARMVATHASAKGGMTHDVSAGADAARILFLSDNAALAFGLARLAEEGAAPELLTSALGIADFALAELEDKRGGGFFAHTVDDAAVGVFAERRKPFEDNVAMIRALIKLAVLSPAKAPVYRRAIDRGLRAIATPDAIHDRGRFVGDLLLALGEATARSR
jgi:hypothetical protein